MEHSGPVSANLSKNYYILIWHSHFFTICKLKVLFSEKIDFINQNVKLIPCFIEYLKCSTG